MLVLSIFIISIADLRRLTDELGKISDGKGANKTCQRRYRCTARSYSYRGMTVEIPLRGPCAILNSTSGAWDGKLLGLFAMPQLGAPLTLHNLLLFRLDLQPTATQPYNTRAS
jgi:hypothetical protein